MTRPTFLAHRATVALMAAVVLVATGDGFAQSYAGLYRWALEHHLSGWKAQSFPLLVDLFIAVGELGMFALALEGHRLARRGMSWADLALPFGIASAGWGVSLVFNVGSVGHRFADQATAAVPPVASMLGLLVLLRTLHRLVVTAPETTSTTVVEPGRPVVDETETQAPGGYSLWDRMPPIEARVQPWWPLPMISTGDVADVVERPAGEGEEIPDLNHENGRVVDDDQPGQDPDHGLASAVKATRESGWSERQIAEAFEISRHRVRKLLKQPADTVNGHDPATGNGLADTAGRH